MADADWVLLDADADEARWFGDLERTRACVVGPAAPPNRFRRVHEVRAGGRRYFLKEFAHTQWKNRVRARCTAPRCRLDGEREHLVAAALKARGVDVARPVAVGRAGGASFYLCAELEGRSLRAHLEAGTCDRRRASAAARFAGGILAAGVHLPDLSAEHVFVREDAGGDRFAVIDLHNGALRQTRGARSAVRILRRFARSVRGLPVDRPEALGFAARLLRAAGYRPADRRRVIERLPPFDTHGRYEVPGRSRAYRQRSRRRTARELELLRRVWPGRPGELVLDSPAGAGRLAATLTEQLRARRVGADRALAMLREARAAGDATPLVQADALALPLRDRSADGVVVFRFLHHLAADDARRAVLEAARVADRFLVVTFFHPVSVHGVSRRLRGLLRGAARTRFAIRLATLRGWLRTAGFEECGHAADRAFLRDFWVAAFRRG